MKANIYIDYESIPKIKLEDFNREEFNLFIIGNALSTFDPDDEKYIEEHKNIYFYTSKGKDHNSLLFLLCAIVGQHNATEDINTEFIIISKNRSISNTLKFIKSNSRKCRRLEDINVSSIEHSLNLNKPKEAISDQDIDTEHIKDVLSKIKPNKRPKKIKAIKSYIANLFKDYSNKDEIAAIVYKKLIDDEFFFETSNNNLTYSTHNIKKNNNI